MTKHAKDYQCSDCDKQAEVFWPVVDPDIPYLPYCKECALKRKMDLLIRMHEEGKGW